MADEADFQARVLDAARKCGWKLYRPPAARGSRLAPNARGWPDATLHRGARLLCLEFKAGSKASAEQTDWIERLSSVPGITAAIVEPDDEEWIYLQLTMA